ncbi:MAG: adenosylcobinamide kinase and adenosylcobinamide phosphate guanylyltransferase [Verrucomicrobiota bacterium]
MSHLILVTGGSRSGKSAYAQHRAETLPGPHGFLATCPVIDPEMQQRVDAHRLARHGHGWTTVEEPVALAAAIELSAHLPVLLIDCLTLWVNNLMFDAEQRGQKISEHSISECCQRLIHSCRKHAGTIIIVTNEVGMGIIPDNADARHFRDLAGRANQEIAHHCDEVILVVCGQPLTIKSQTLSI